MKGSRRDHELLERLSVGLYRVGLRRYPAAFRRAHGQEMVTDARRLLREAIAEYGLWGWALTTLRILRDLLRPLPAPIETGAGVPRAGGRRRQSEVTGRGGYASDVACAARALRRSPALAALVVGVLGVGVGLNVSILAVVDAYLIEALPYPDADRLVEVRPATTAASWTNVETVFERAVAWELDGFTLVGGDDSEVTLGAFVSPDFFEVFGVRPALGRTFGLEEAGPVAVISHGLWRRRFGADPEVLGRKIRAFTGDGAEVGEGLTIVGVLPRDFWYLNRYTDILAPLREPSPVRIGRLRPDMPPGRAEELLTERVVAQASGAAQDSRIRLRPLQAAYTAAVRPKLVVLQAAALLTLLVACANAGLLLMVRATGRHYEMGIRRALGADARRLAVQLVSEGLILSLAASLVGIALAWGVLDTLGPFIEARLGRAVPGGISALGLDGSTVLVAVGACVLIGLTFGAGSLRAATRPSLRSLIGSGGWGATGRAGGRYIGGTLVAAEIALSLTLLTGGALVVRSALHLEAVPLGFEPSGLVSYTVGYTTPGSSGPAQRTRFFEQLVERASYLPGVEAAGMARAAPFASRLTSRTLEAEGAASTTTLPEVVPQIASPGFLRVLRLDMLRGRPFDRDDGPGSTLVGIVSESLASLLWPSEDPLGSRIRFQSWSMPEMEEKVGPWLVVVGVVPDIVDQLEENRATVYVPYRQAPSAWMTLVLRRRPGAASVTSGVKDILRELDPEVPIYSEDDLARGVAVARAPARFLAGLLGGLSAFSLLLAVVGLYGITQFAARRRMPELAVRMILGADRTSVEGLFVRQALVSISTGLVLGAIGGRLLSTALRAQLHGIRPEAITTPMAVAILLGVTALLAVWLPVRKASGSDLSSVLRQE